MSANDLIIFEFEGSGEREVSIRIIDLLEVANAFGRLMAHVSDGAADHVELLLVEAQQGSLKVGLRARVEWIRSHHSELGSYAGLAALAIALLQVFDAPGAHPSTSPIDRGVALCAALAVTVHAANAGALIICEPDGASARIEPDLAPALEKQFSITVHSQYVANEVADRLRLFRGVRRTSITDISGDAIDDYPTFRLDVFLDEITPSERAELMKAAKEYAQEIGLSIDIT